MISKPRIPAEVFPLSELLQDEIDARGWTLHDVAIRMGGDYATDFLTLLLVMNIHDKDVLLGNNTAKALSRVFDINPELFINIDAAWRLSP